MIGALFVIETVHEHAGLLVYVREHLAHAAKEMQGGLVGGFLAYFVHTLHHRIWHFLTPKKLRGGSTH